MTTTAPARRSFLRTPWVVPIAVTSAVALSVLAQPLFASGDANNLPEVSAEQLVTQVLDAKPQAMSGTVVHTARLGLPDMLFTGATGADPISLLGGSSTLRVWTDGQERSRVALLGTMSEYSVVTDGPQMWTYSSSADEAVHYSFSDADLVRLKAMGEEARAEALKKQAELPTPQEAATEALAQVGEYSSVRVDSQSTVAGREVYQLIVTPKTDKSLVSRVVLSIDGQTKIPLRVQTWSSLDKTAPALEVSFTDVKFGMPSESVFGFTAPAGTTERNVVVPLPQKDGAVKGSDATHEMPVVSGTGWESVVEFENVDVAAMLAKDPSAMPSSERIIGSEQSQKMLKEFMPEHSGGMTLDPGALYDQLTTKVPEGRLLSTTLLNILVTNDGRVLVGAVPAETLRAMA